MDHSIVRSPAGGIGGLFAINFASQSEVDLELRSNVIGGGLNATGGVGRPNAVTGSTVSIQSRRNLYRADNDAPQPNGWSLIGGTTAPIPGLASKASTFNALSMHSNDDTIEGFPMACLPPADSGPTRSPSRARRTAPTWTSTTSPSRRRAPTSSCSAPTRSSTASRRATRTPSGCSSESHRQRRPREPVCRQLDPVGRRPRRPQRAPDHRHRAGVHPQQRRRRSDSAVRVLHGTEVGRTSANRASGRRLNDDGREPSNQMKNSTAYFSSFEPLEGRPLDCGRHPRGSGGSRRSQQFPIVSGTAYRATSSMGPTAPCGSPTRATPRSAESTPAAPSPPSSIRPGAGRGSRPDRTATSGSHNRPSREWLDHACGNRHMFPLPPASTLAWTDRIGRVPTEGSGSPTRRESDRSDYPLRPIAEFDVPTTAAGLSEIAAGTDGSVWFAEFDTRIGRITTLGAIYEYELPTAESRPTSVAAGPDGNIWFTAVSRSQSRTNHAGGVHHRVPFDARLGGDRLRRRPLVGPHPRQERSPA